MGIEFGPGAKVQVKGDMVGGDKITIQRGAWEATAAAIMADAGLELSEKDRAAQSLAALHLELEKAEPDKERASQFLTVLRGISSKAFDVLLVAAPELIKILPGLVS